MAGEQTEKLLDLDTVANKLGVSVATIHRYTKLRENPLPVYKITGRTFRIKEEDLKKWLLNYKKGKHGTSNTNA